MAALHDFCHLAWLNVPFPSSPSCPHEGLEASCVVFVQFKGSQELVALVHDGEVMNVEG